MVSRDEYRTFGRNCDSDIEGGTVTFEDIRKVTETDGFIQQIKKSKSDQMKETIKEQKYFHFQSAIKRLRTLAGW